jgi:RNA polymerase sigma factor (sigma-70 family)
MQHREDDYYIDRIRAGENTAYSFLVEKYKHMTYTLALRVLRNEEDAEDAAQEGFVKAFQQLRQFERKSKFSTWLYTIVYRTAIYKLKHRSSSFFSIDEKTHGKFINASLGVHEDLQLQDERDHVHRAIAKLPETEAVLITLYYIDENTVKEIQEITGLSTPNIKIRLFRARKKLERDLHFLISNEILSYDKK